MKIRKNNCLKPLAVMALALSAMSVKASPARPFPLRYVQPDGQVVTVYLRGDERVHFYENIQGKMLIKDNLGRLCYATLNERGDVVASSQIAVDKTKDVEMTGATDEMQLQLRSALSRASRTRNQQLSSALPGEVKKTFPTTGKMRGLIILAEFTDKKFSRDDAHEIFSKLANEVGYTGPYASGSIRDYFLSQSQGLFEPEFDVVGPVALPQSMSYYGLDERIVDLMVDACTVADKEHGVDFSLYDHDDDGTVDFLYVIYAGYSEAQGAAEDAIWPQSKDLTYSTWKTFDGMYLGQSSCSSELQGNYGADIDGIGTFCHEFSHILGLPDIYDPMYSGCNGMMHWDIMDVGIYNDASRTPSGFTAMDRYSLGWLQPTVLHQAVTDFELEALSSSNQAVFIVNPSDPNEYYILENRQPIAWDAALPGHGLLVSHVHYVPSLWSSNRVNTSMSGYEHVALVPADNITSVDTEAADTYPGEAGRHTELSASSTPALFWHQGEQSYQLPVTSIREENGVIRFHYLSDASGIDSAPFTPSMVRLAEGSIDINNQQRQSVRLYRLSGELIASSTEATLHYSLASGVYLLQIGDTIQKIFIK